METLRAIVRIEVIGILLAFAVVLVWKASRGVLRFEGLLEVRNRAGRLMPSAARFQLLVATMGVALVYLSKVIHQTDHGALPPMGAGALALVGGSHALFLGTTARRWIARALG